MMSAASWYPKDPDGFSARWILLHVIEELARHAGHQITAARTESTSGRSAAI